MAVVRPITRPAASAPSAAPAPAALDDTPRYTISEVAARSGLTAHTLRWYERIGLLERIDRSYSGQRRYSDKDLGWLSFLGKLRLTGMSVADMVRYAELVRAGEQTVGERHQLLYDHREEVRQRIADLQATLVVLDYKISLYSDAAPAAEGKRTV
ncbi:MerR family transcriptional regulator [Peterkaempfera griseoplana]|uniref:MerR family transcriptional regulator n=1 Tax=Peterkaempfera griseoplana TaxID=66896 RepID=UPI0006E2F8F0|nr:MerR family transcriptional regulator [Peterkaempfera griseoplana]